MGSIICIMYVLYLKDYSILYAAKIREIIVMLNTSPTEQLSNIGHGLRKSVHHYPTCPGTVCCPKRLKI